MTIRPHDISVNQESSLCFDNPARVPCDFLPLSLGIRLTCRRQEHLSDSERRWLRLLALDNGEAASVKPRDSPSSFLLNPFLLFVSLCVICLLMKKKTKNKQEASSRLAAGVAAAGNAAVRVALAAQEGEEGESRAGEERPGAGAQEEQPQKDEVK